MLVLFSCVRWVWCVCFLLTRVALASDWQSPTAELAGKIAALTGPGVVALELSNLSSIAPADVEVIKRGLTASLATAGVRVWQVDQAGIRIRVTLSENLQNYLWVAELQQGTGDDSVAMISVARPAGALIVKNTPALTLHARKLLSRPDRILDVAVLDGPPRRMLALGVEVISIYEWNNSQWNLAQVLAIHPSHPFPRDARGRIIPAKDHLFDVYLPGLICRGTNSNPAGIDCSPSDDPWPLQTSDFGLGGFFSPARNFFTGAIVPGIGKQKSAPPFYSAAAIPRPNYTLWVISGVDGELHLLDGINQQTLSKVRWGSDVAGIRSPCATGWLILASSADSDSEDLLQAFEFPDHEPVAVSQKLNLSGSITSLWTAYDGNSGIAVYRDLETGDYEAVQLIPTCGQ